MIFEPTPIIQLFKNKKQLFFYAAMKPPGEGSLYAAQIGCVGFYWFPGEGAASFGTAIYLDLFFFLQ
jgi:hypothetical protein